MSNDDEYELERQRQQQIEAFKVEWFRRVWEGDGDVVLSTDPDDDDDQASTVLLICDRDRGRVLVVDDWQDETPDDQQRQALHDFLHDQFAQAEQSLQVIAKSAQALMLQVQDALQELVPRPPLPDELTAELAAMARRGVTLDDWEYRPLHAEPQAWPEPGHPHRPAAWQPSPTVHRRPRRGPWTLPWIPA